MIPHSTQMFSFLQTTLLFLLLILVKFSCTKNQVLHVPDEIVVEMFVALLHTPSASKLHWSYLVGYLHDSIQIIGENLFEVLFLIEGAGFLTYVSHLLIRLVAVPLSKFLFDSHRSFHCLLTFVHLLRYLMVDFLQHSFS